MQPRSGVPPHSSPALRSEGPASSRRSGRGGPPARFDSENAWTAQLIDLYRSQYDALCRLALTVVRCEQTAHDITQDAFIRFQRAQRRCAPGRELQYLRSIVLNTARSRVRREIRERAHVHGVAAPVPSPEAECISGIEFVALLERLRTLPARQRQTMVCRFVLDRSERETAQALRISSGTVKAHVSRARATMQAQLAH